MRLLFSSLLTFLLATKLCHADVERFSSSAQLAQAQSNVPSKPRVVIHQNNLIVEKEVSVTVGSTTSFYCELPDEPQTITTCQIDTPAPEMWTVENGQVLDSNGNPVPGYFAVDNGNPSKVCGLGIDSIQSSDLGDWVCRITRTNGATSILKGVVNMRTESKPANARLSLNTLPYNYNVDLITVMDPDYRTEGQFEIESQVFFGFVNDGYFTVHIDLIEIDESSIVLSSSGTNLEILEHIYDFERQFYTVRYVPPPANASFPLTVTGSFTGVINNAFFGVYRTSYETRAGETVPVALTQFETAGARFAFPCLDEPAFKAFFNFRIGREQAWNSDFNMPMVSTGQPVDGYPNYVWDVYQGTPLMSTYLLAFSISKYDKAVSTPLANGVEHSVITRPDAVADGIAEYAKNLGPEIIQGYEITFQQPYALPKEDEISIPGTGGGAMENWGLITYGERGLLMDPRQTSDAEKYAIASVMAHELAHQWFGNLVTCDWWDDIWLNEGFAVFVSYIGVDIVEPSMRVWDRFYVDEMQSLMRYDSRPTTPPMLVEVNNPTDTDFGILTYNRGGTMIRMMEFFLTQPSLGRGMNEYLEAYKYSTAVTRNLFDELDRVAKEDGTLNPQYNLNDIMNRWQTQPNYPLVTVTRNYQTGAVTLTQERFLTEPDPVPKDYQWYVPITYTMVGDQGADFNTTINSNTWLEPDSTLNINLPLNNDSVVFNIQNTGYYRVNYDQENWRRISEFMNNDNNHQVIHPINRAQILYDSYALAVAGIESYDLALQMATYLDKENDYVPLSTILFIYEDIGITLPAQEYKQFLEAQLTSRFDVIGIAANPNANFVDNLLQRELASTVCGLDYPSCLADSSAVFNQWMQAANPDDPDQNPVNKEVRYTVYCKAIQNGGLAERNFLTERGANSFEPHEKRAINNALNC